MRHGGLGRAISQTIWQATPTRYAAHHADVASALLQEHGQDRVQHAQQAVVIDVLMAQHVGQVELCGALCTVMPRAIQQEVEFAACSNLARHIFHLQRIRHIQGEQLHGQALAFAGCGPLRQSAQISSRNNDMRAGCMQSFGTSQTNAT